MKHFIVFLLIVFPFCLKAQQLTEHTVASGETIQSIANKYNISVADLKGVNPGLNDYMIAGMVLKLPTNAISKGEGNSLVELVDDLKDVIYMKDGSELVAKISNIGTDSVFFEQYDTDELFSIPITRITSISFENGAVKDFTEPKPKNTKKTITTKRRK